jgi:protein-tyrosine phosphatase
MVCLGNICRSPMAEGILRHKLRGMNLSVYTDSAGTSGFHIGQTPDSRAVDCLKEYGIDISDLRSRQFNKSDFAKYDLIYVMDRSNYNDVIEMARTPEDESKVAMIMNETNPETPIDVPDPWYGDEAGFHDVYRMLDGACDVIVRKIAGKN